MNIQVFIINVHTESDMIRDDRKMIKIQHKNEKNVRKLYFDFEFKNDTLPTIIEGSKLTGLYCTYVHIIIHNAMFFYLGCKVWLWCWCNIINVLCSYISMNIKTRYAKISTISVNEGIITFDVSMSN